MEQKALEFSEKYGILDYTVEGHLMTWIESYPTEGDYQAVLDLNTMQEIYRGKVLKFTPLKNRPLVQGQKVKVYFNLHKKCFSIMDVKTGLVIAHADAVNLHNVEFKVSETGRQRVIREKKKNVHAFVIGEYQGAFVGQEKRSAYYNPYKTSHFLDEDGHGLLKVASVTCVNKQIKYSERWT